MTDEQLRDLVRRHLDVCERVFADVGGPPPALRPTLSALTKAISTPRRELREVHPEDEERRTAAPHPLNADD